MSAELGVTWERMQGPVLAQPQGRMVVGINSFFIPYLGLQWVARRGECERGDSNPHGHEPRDPKSRASTNSATFAATGKKHNRGRKWYQQALSSHRVR